MIKTLILNIVLLGATLSSMAQTVNHPQVLQSDDPASVITQIEHNSDYTIVHFEYTAPGDSSWLQLNKEIFIQTDVNNEHYPFVMAKNINMAPQKQYLKKQGDKLAFEVYFKRIPVGAKTIDIFERPGIMKNGISYFNFYDIDLTGKAQQRTKITDVVLTPPSNEGINMVDSMVPMITGMTRSMMDAQLAYYKQPEKIKDVAKVTRQYYDALIKVGFTADQALKIITTDGLLPKASGNK